MLPCDDCEDIYWEEVSRFGIVPTWFGYLECIPTIKHLLMDWRFQLGYELAAIFLKILIAVENCFSAVKKSYSSE